jgi:hypothetical protein
MEYIRIVDGEDEMHVAEVLDIREDKIRFKSISRIKQSVLHRFNSIRKIILSKSHLAQTNWDFLWS